jgi:opacity protein-like surface antigen
MGCLRTFAIAAGFAAASVSAAQAADLGGLPPMLPAPPPMVEEFASGWYLRGDVGYRYNPDPGAFTLTGVQPTNVRLDDAYMIGGGVGYKARWFRADLTVDYGTGANFYANGAIADDYRAKLDSVAIMLNGYLDLGTWYGFTPYVGAGIGGALLQITEFSQLSAVNTFDTPRGSKWNFAWAAMAGFGYNISQNFLLDIGYRYISLGEVQSEPTSLSNRLTVDGVAAHELRVGFRYLID